MIVSELTGAQLSEVVSKVLGKPIAPYAIDWSMGGPVIEKHEISIYPSWTGTGLWWAKHPHDPHHPVCGKTPLEAAMRCIVRHALGDEFQLLEGVQL